MHVLLIGCGYLGLRAALSWREQGHRVTALTRHPSRIPDWTKQGIEAIVGDVVQPASLTQLPAADLCLYAVGYDRTGTADKRSVYVDGVENVLREIRTRVPRLIFISSTSVYGQESGETIDEFSRCEPSSESGIICRDAEKMVQELYPVQDATPSAVILRSAGLYGPGRLIARQEQLKLQTPLPGRPDAWLNLIHVDDAVQAIQKQSQRPFADPVYLLSDERPLTRSEFYGAIAERIGAPEPLFVPGDDNSLNKRCQSMRIREALSLNLKYPNAIVALDELIGLAPGAGCPR